MARPKSDASKLRESIEEISALRREIETLEAECLRYVEERDEARSELDRIDTILDAMHDPVARVPVVDQNGSSEPMPTSVRLCVWIARRKGV